MFRENSFNNAAVYILKRIGERTVPCWSPFETEKDFDDLWFPSLSVNFCLVMIQA